MNCAKQLVDLFWIVIALKRKQAIAHDLQMLFGFRLEELQNLCRDFVVFRQRIKIGTRRRRNNFWFFLTDQRGCGIGARGRKIQWRWLDGERKAIPLLERGNVLNVFLARVADLEEVSLQNRNAVRQKFRKWPVQVFA